MRGHFTRLHSIKTEVITHSLDISWMSQSKHNATAAYNHPITLHKIPEVFVFSFIRICVILPPNEAHHLHLCSIVRMHQKTWWHRVQTDWTKRETSALRFLQIQLFIRLDSWVFAVRNPFFIIYPDVIDVIIDVITASECRRIVKNISCC